MANPGFRPWTADDIAKLKSLARRATRQEIAEKLGRSVSATSVKAHKLKLSLKKRDASDLADDPQSPCGSDEMRKLQHCRL
jgi:hypothetical protein